MTPPTLQSSMPPGSILEALARTLRDAGRHEPRLLAEWLLSHTLGCARLELPQRHDARLTPAQFQELEHALPRLAAGEPLQYVLGDAEFMGRRFRVDPGVLIPRPETEELVEEILQFNALWRIPAPRIADIGTGSGSIVISLTLARPAGRYLATDLSPDALARARDNARQHGVENRIAWACCDLLPDPEARADSPSSRDSFDAIVSNPPYVTTAEWEHLPASIRAFEPRLALDGGPDGLAVIRRLASLAAGRLTPDGALFLEIGAGQATAVQSLLAAAGFQDVRVRKDLSGKDRMVIARRQQFT